MGFRKYQRMNEWWREPGEEKFLLNESEENSKKPKPPKPFSENIQKNGRSEMSLSTLQDALRSLQEEEFKLDNPEEEKEKLPVEGEEENLSDAGEEVPDEEDEKNVSLEFDMDTSEDFSAISDAEDLVQRIVLEVDGKKYKLVPVETSSEEDLVNIEDLDNWDTEVEWEAEEEGEEEKNKEIPSEVPDEPEEKQREGVTKNKEPSRKSISSSGLDLKDTIGQKPFPGKGPSKKLTGITDEPLPPADQIPVSPTEEKDVSASQKSIEELKNHAKTTAKEAIAAKKARLQASLRQQEEEEEGEESLKDGVDELDFDAIAQLDSLPTIIGADPKVVEKIRQIRARRLARQQEALQESASESTSTPASEEKFDFKKYFK